MKTTDLKNDVCFFTAEYPYSTGETFIENEIPYLSKGFEHVSVFPYLKKGEKRDLPANVSVNPFSVDINKRLHIADIFLMLRILLYEFFYMRNKFFFIRRIRTWIKILKNAIIVSRDLEGSLRMSASAGAGVYYSYWMNEWALVLSVLKVKGKIDRFVFRCAGYDIWDERYEGNYLPFRFFIYQQASGVYPNSKMGERYLKRIGHFPEKVECKYWGTNDHGTGPYGKDELLTIVSCSSVIPLKRVQKIAGVISGFQRPVKWVHFGDGPLMKELSEQVRGFPEHITVELRGNVRNSEVMKYYSANPVTCFINASTTESLPVSMQEAMSFGIPVIGTNVGGVAEIVDESTGLLLDVDFDDSKTASRIAEMAATRFSDPVFRQGIRERWRTQFSAGQNYTRFVDLLKSRSE